MKVIAYYVVDSSDDGTSKEDILYASFSEDNLDLMIASDRAKQWRTKKRNKNNRRTEKFIRRRA